MEFKQEFDFIKRKEESKRISSKFLDRIPLIIQRASHSKKIPKIDKRKYLVPCTLTLGQLLYIVRKRIKLDATQALFLFINNNLLPTSALICDIYEKNKDDDGFLYVYYSGEETFG